MLNTDRYNVVVTDRNGNKMRSHTRLELDIALDILSTVVHSNIKLGTQFAFIKEQTGDRVLSVEGNRITYRMTKI